MRNPCRVLFGLFFAAIALCASCRRSGVVASVGEERLFALKYGSFEDELDLFSLSRAGAVRTYMAMRDGFFYIANGEARKIMELNSYGDLLTLYYNDEAGGAPSFASDNAENATRKAVAYPFSTLGPIAVDGRKYLYAVDTLPPERHETDEKERLALRSVVLRFAADGSFVDYLGQQGPGGTPFPFVRALYATAANELVAVCVTNGGFAVYWFGEDGFLRYSVPVTAAAVPNPYKEGAEDAVYVSVENVVPDLLAHRLYLKVDYFANTLDPALKVQSGVEYQHTLLYPLDLDTGRYDAPLEIPAYEDTVSEGLGTESRQLPYDFLGVTESGWFFFSVPTERGFAVQMVQPNGQRILRRTLGVNHGDILYYAMHLDEEGILSALFVKRDEAEVDWWRTDSLIDAFLKN